MISISNDGPSIMSTTYWATEHARRGLLYLSINAGALRLLVPDAVRGELIGSLPPVGTECEAVISPATVRVVWLDDPEQPYEIEIDARQCDRRPLPEDDGRVLALVMYGRDGSDGVVEIRREAATIRRGRS